MWCHDFTCDALPATQLDLVHVRWLLDLLPDREGLVEKLVTALKPAGWLLVEEPDMFLTAAELPGAYHRTLFKSRFIMSGRTPGVSPQKATVPAKEYESSDQRILASGGTVALPSYYRSHDVADAGTRETGERYFAGPVE